MKKCFSCALLFFMALTITAQIKLGADIDGESSGDQSGWSVSLSSDGSILAIGAPNNDGQGSNSGQVRVYEYKFGAWTKLVSDINGEASDDQFGSSVSLSGDGSILAVGAIGNDGNGSNSGHVRTFKLNTGNWVQIGQTIDGEASGDQSGWSLSLSEDGTILAIGAIDNDGNGNSSGHVRVYQFSSNIWSQIGTDINGIGPGDWSGFSTSLSNDGKIVAIGSMSGSGLVRVFEYMSGTWTQLGNSILGENTGDKSGWSLSLSENGEIVAIGAPFNSGNGSSAGHVRVFEYDAGSWVQKGDDIDGESAGDQSGQSLCLSDDGNIVAVGAPNNGGNLNLAGQVRVYQFKDDNWTLMVNEIDGEGIGDFSGWSVSLSSDASILAIGARDNDGKGSNSNYNSGSVRVYQLYNTVGINLTNNKDEFDIYPNPSEGIFTIQSSNHTLNSIEIYSTFGRLIYNGLLKENGKVDLTGQLNGLYLLKINTEVGQLSQRILKQ